MGITKMTLETGSVLSVIGREGGYFLCDYLGDTIKVPAGSSEPTE